MSLQIAFGLIGGLSLFVFGMQKMAEGLQSAAGDRLKRILEMFTSRPIIAVVTGALATVLVQSSSTTTVIVVGFVNAGLMNLAQAVGTIMGANVGTTITAQIVSFDIYAVALPVIGIGGLINFLSRRKLYKYIGLSILGFGLLIYGMSIMSDSISPLRDHQFFLDMLVSFSKYPLLGILAGTLFTFLVQSSSATTGLVIAFSLQGLIDLPSGIAIILGANVGTCITAMLAAIGTTLAAKRAAVAHLFFNLIGVIIFTLFLRPFVNLVQYTDSNVTRQIANAHTVFNLTNTVVLFPFITPFVKFIRKIVPGEEPELQQKPLYLDRNILHSPAALIAATKEIMRMCDISLNMLRNAYHSFIDKDEKLIADVTYKEDIINEVEKQIITYLTEASGNPWTDKQQRRITNLLHSVHDIERVGDLSMNIIELSQSRIDHNLALSETAINELEKIFNKVESIYIRAIEVLRNEDYEKAKELIPEDDIVDQMEISFRDSHIKRLNEGRCHPESGVLFLDLISNLERIADHANNLAEAVTGDLLAPIQK